jgi:hypothetical protein
MLLHLQRPYRLKVLPPVLIGSYCPTFNRLIEQAERTAGQAKPDADRRRHERSSGKHPLLHGAVPMTD